LVDQGASRSVRLLSKLSSSFSWQAGGESRPLDRVGIFWDYASLPQPKRTDIEQQRFKKGLASINVLYSDGRSIVIQLKQLPSPSFDGMNDTPYHERGWCKFEEAVSSIIKGHNSHVGELLDLQAGSKVLEDTRPNANYYALSRACMVTRHPPLSPDDFAEVLANLKFTNGGDRDVVADMYREFFGEVCAAAKKIDFSRPWNWRRREDSWGPPQAAYLPVCCHAFVVARSCICIAIMNSGQERQRARNWLSLWGNSHSCGRYYSCTVVLAIPFLVILSAKAAFSDSWNFSGWEETASLRRVWRYLQPGYIAFLRS